LKHKNLKGGIGLWHKIWIIFLKIEHGVSWTFQWQKGQLMGSGVQNKANT
jgi:hypothetical protein